jgi:adenylosuccinate lyase
MLQNLNASHGLPFSGRVLLKLVEAGLSREAAYDIVQRNAMRAWETDEQLRDLIAADPDAGAVPASVLDEAFDLADFLRHVRVPFDRALSLREEPIDVHA